MQCVWRVDVLVTWLQCVSFQVAARLPVLIIQQYISPHLVTTSIPGTQQPSPVSTEHSQQSEESIQSVGFDSSDSAGASGGGTPVNGQSGAAFSFEQEEGKWRPGGGRNEELRGMDCMMSGAEGVSLPLFAYLVVVCLTH